MTSLNGRAQAARSVVSLTGLGQAAAAASGFLCRSKATGLDGVW